MRRDFSSNTKEIIAKRAGYQCSYPGCTCGTIGPATDSQKVVNVGEACHICAASPGGPRYDPNMTDEECVSVDNGIWMCRTHAAEIDRDVERYTADILKKWKNEAEERADNNRTNHTISPTKIKYLMEFVSPTITIILSYSLYGRIRETPLRYIVSIDIILACLLLIFLIASFIITKYAKNSVPIYSKKLLLLGAALIAVLIVSLILGVLIELNNVPETKIETDVMIVNEQKVLHEEELEAAYGCVLDDGRHCIEMGVMDEDLVPFFKFDICNGKKDTIILNDYDAVVVDLLEYIPYENLNIVQHGGGGDGHPETIAFRLNMSKELGIQFATPLIDGKDEGVSGDMITISENEVKRFKLKIYPEEKGFYRFKVIVNYRQGDENKSFETKEYNYVCGLALEDLKYSRDEIQFESIGDESLLNN